MKWEAITKDDDNDTRDRFLTSTVALEMHISLILMQEYIVKGLLYRIRT